MVVREGFSGAHGVQLGARVADDVIREIALKQLKQRVGVALLPAVVCRNTITWVVVQVELGAELLIEWAAGEGETDAGNGRQDVGDAEEQLGR